ncbi:MAG: hypothetical protein ACTSRK_03555 [Promethearchaeota archaeon]
MSESELEVSLVELEKWYLEQLGDRFKREHKYLSKIFSKSAEQVAQAKNALKAWLNSKPEKEEEKLDDKTKKIMARFIDSVLNSLDEVIIPTIHTTISYENCHKFNEGIKKVFTTYNVHGKKVMRRFYKQYKLEIKEIDLHLRKLGDFSQKVVKFQLKNYQEGKEAELLLKKIPLLENNIERLGTTKSKLDEMEGTFAGMEERRIMMEQELEKISEDPDLQEFQDMERRLDIAKRDFRETLKFKKAFKKMKKFLEKGTISVRDISESDLKPYLKDSVGTILAEGPKIPRLRQILIKTRIMLEDERDYLQLKSELKVRVIENINEIVSNNSLESEITKILSLVDEKAEIRKKLQKKGLESQRNELREKIAIATIDSEHFENDVQRYKRDYKDLLSKVKEDRKDLQKGIKEETGEEIKIKIIIPT